MTAIGIFFALLQLAGFVGGAIAGGRVYDRFANKRHPIALGAVIIAVLIGYMFISNGAIPNEWVRAALFTGIAFAGGLLVRGRNDIVKGG